PRHLCRFLSALLPPLFYPLTPPPPTHRLSLHDALPIYRERARQSSPENPRAESIQEAIHHLKQRGLGRDEVIELLRNLDIQPTLTAHPTEARRRSILYKQQHIANLLAESARVDKTPEETEYV